MNSPTCITNTDQCDFVGTDCCFQEPSGPPCWAMPPMTGMKDGIAIMTGGGIGEPGPGERTETFFATNSGVMSGV